MTATAVFSRHAEIQANGLGMSDMQVAVGLRRKARDYPRMLSRLNVGPDNIPYKVRGRGFSLSGIGFRHRGHQRPICRLPAEPHFRCCFPAGYLAVPLGYQLRQKQVLKPAYR